MCRRANVVAHQRPQKIGFLGRRTLTDGGLDVWRDPIDDRFDVSGIRTVAGPDGVDGRRDGATTRMAKHHNQAGTELRGRELDGPDDRRGHHVSGNSDDEEIAEALKSTSTGVRESEQPSTMAKGRCGFWARSAEKTRAAWTGRASQKRWLPSARRSAASNGESESGSQVRGTTLPGTWYSKPLVSGQPFAKVAG